MLEQQQRLEETNDCAQGNGCRYNEVRPCSPASRATQPRPSARVSPFLHEVISERWLIPILDT